MLTFFQSTKKRLSISVPSLILCFLKVCKFRRQLQECGNSVTTPPILSLFTRPCLNFSSPFSDRYVEDRDAEEVLKNKLLKAQTVAATLTQPCLARNTLLYHLLYKYTAFFFLKLEIQCYIEIHLNIMHTHYAQFTRGKEEENKQNKNNTRFN